MTEAELVLTHVLNCDRLSLYLNKDVCLDRNKSVQVSAILKRRIIGEPLQYILGSTEFMGYEFKVDKRALIPRPETEILISSALEKLKSTGKTNQLKILDLGTGSGCIAVCLAKLLPQALIWATDVSWAALQLAKENADLHKVKVKFLWGDIFGALEKDQKEFDLIISNPPYIAKQEFCGLAKEIFFEPVLALEAGIDGTDFYRRIISQAAGYLKEDGFLILEMGLGQRSAIEDILRKSKNFKVIEIIKDYNNIERVMVAGRSKSEILNPKL
ncbi:MAG: peptide chain release factor N(5)-glutamine methyltransferase [Candidatus Omnitrophica bacterium]|nr:peptide chain release factor N(5)-glutamine methyltransferase [Candidatus Omnitrophota bacterium]